MYPGRRTFRPRSRGEEGGSETLPSSIVLFRSLSPSLFLQSFFTKISLSPFSLTHFPPPSSCHQARRGAVNIVTQLVRGLGLEHIRLLAPVMKVSMYSFSLIYFVCLSPLFDFSFYFSLERVYIYISRPINPPASLPSRPLTGPHGRFATCRAARQGRRHTVGECHCCLLFLLLVAVVRCRCCCSLLLLLLVAVVRCRCCFKQHPTSLRPSLTAFTHAPRTPSSPPYLRNSLLPGCDKRINSTYCSGIF